jgi:hypothetical protein
MVGGGGPGRSRQRNAISAVRFARVADAEDAHLVIFEREEHAVVGFPSHESNSRRYLKIALAAMFPSQALFDGCKPNLA